MPCRHTNRKGQTYHLQSGRTKTGKTRYYMGRKVTGTAEERVPDGYEIWENPETAQVYVRKARPSPIIDAERELLEEAIRAEAGLEHFIVDVEEEHLVVYLLDQETGDIARTVGSALDMSDFLFRAVRDTLTSHGTYQKMMRFTLVDEDERLFAVERWCFKGSIDDWFPLRGYAPLADLAAEYVPHLGRESFYELML